MVGKLTIKAFDLNTRKSAPLGIPEGNPADSYLISYEVDSRSIHILVDAGKPGQGDDIIIPYLMEQGIEKIDYMVLSHMHLDHYGGMVDLLRDDRVTIDHWMFSPLPESLIQNSNRAEFYDYWVELCSLIKEKRVNIREIDRSDIGKRIPLDAKLAIEIISTPHPRFFDQEQADLNECNLVFNLKYDEFTALFPGDCGDFQANDILNSPQKELVKSVTLLKAAHHGGDNTLNPAFIEWCDPQIVLIPCNDKVVEHRPTFIQNLHLFTRNGAKVFRGDRCQHFELETDGKEISCNAVYERYSETVII